MLVLVVSSFPEDKKGSVAYKAFLKFVKDIFSKSPDGFNDIRYMERRFNELGDIVVDWEYDRLDKRMQENSIRFDRIDMIVVVGDYSTLPWEPSASQIVSLIHMAKHMNKPYLGVGFGALAAIYTFSTKGARFNVLNGPYGGCIEDLPSFPNYSLGSGAYPSGWLDRETGDMYTYNKASRLWHPVCNIGIHFVASKGAVGSPRGQPPAQKHISYDDMVDPSQPFYRQDGSHEAVRFRSNVLNHYLLRGIPTNSHHFIVNLHPEWYTNREGALPTNDKLVMIGECHKAPVLFLRENMLLLCCKAETADQFRTLTQLVSNFLHRIVLLTMESSTDKIELSMNEFLFGAVEMGHGKYDSLRDRASWTPALSKVSIATSLKEGPIRVEPPVLEMFFRTSTRDHVDYYALTGKRRSSSVGRRPPVEIQNPLSMKSRKKRLEQALQRLGLDNPNNVVEKSLQTSQELDPLAALLHMPEAAKEMLTGKVMPEQSITTRRHHKDIRAKILSFEEISKLQYAKFPSSSASSTMNPSGQPSRDEGDDFRASPSPPNESRQSSPSRGAFSRGETRVAFSASPSPSPHPLPSHVDKDGARKEERAGRGLTLPSPSAVPKIEGWERVFRVGGETTLLSEDVRDEGTARSLSTTARTDPISSRQASPRGLSSRLGSSSPRGVRNTSPTTSLPGSASSRAINVVPWSAATSREGMATPQPPPTSPATSRSLRYGQSPRSAHAILHQAVTTQYLPLHRPACLPRRRRFDLQPERHPEEDEEDDDDEEEEEDEEEEVMKDKEGNPVGTASDDIQQVSITTSPRPRHYCNYLGLSRSLKRQEEEEAKVYQGYYVTGYLSALETQALQDKQAKQANLAGDFKTHFNVHKSAMAVRSDGYIRSEGPYPKAPDFGIPPQTKAIEWHALRRTTAEDKEKWVAGPWIR